MSLDVFKGYDGAFLHHVAQVARQGKFGLLAACQSRFDKEDFTAYTGPSQPRNHTREVVALIFVAIVGRFAQEFFDVRRTQATAFRQLIVVGSDAIGCLAQYFFNLLFQTAHTTFARVFLYDIFYRSLGQAHATSHLVLILSQMFGQQMLTSYLALLFGEIALNVDNLHTVEQRRGDSAQRIGRSNEKYL